MISVLRMSRSPVCGQIATPIFHKEQGPKDESGDDNDAGNRHDREDTEIHESLSGHGWLRCRHNHLVRRRASNCRHDCFLFQYHVNGATNQVIERAAGDL